MSDVLLVGRELLERALRYMDTVGMYPEEWSVAEAIRKVLAGPSAEKASAESDAARLVTEQAEDDGLWFEAQTASEAYLQAALRTLHAAVERDAPAEKAMQMALEALDESLDDVTNGLEKYTHGAGYPSYDRRINQYREQIERHKAAIDALRAQLGDT